MVSRGSDLWILVASSVALEMAGKNAFFRSNPINRFAHGQVAMNNNQKLRSVADLLIRANFDVIPPKTKSTVIGLVPR